MNFFKKALLVVVVLSTGLVLFNQCVNDYNTTIYLSSQRRDINSYKLNLYLDDEFIQEVDLKKHYDLDFYVLEKNLTLGEHSVELKTLSGESLFKRDFFYTGIVNWISIGIYEDGEFSFEKFFLKPKFA